MDTHLSKFYRLFYVHKQNPVKTIPLFRCFAARRFSDNDKQLLDSHLIIDVLPDVIRAGVFDSSVWDLIEVMCPYYQSNEGKFSSDLCVELQKLSDEHVVPDVNRDEAKRLLDTMRLHGMHSEQ